MLVFGSDKSTDVNTSLVTFTLKFPDQTVYPVTANEVKFIAGDLNTVNVDEFQRQHSELTDRAFVTPSYGRIIDLLNGTDYLFDILLPQTKITVQPGDHLINSKLGWFVIGRANDNPSSSLVTLLSTSYAVEQLWALDTMGITENVLKQTEEEQIALNIFYDSIKFENQRYEVSFPWREYPPSVPTNYNLALGCLSSQLRKFQNQRAILEEYESILKTQEHSGIIERVEMDFRTKEVHYIPHHAVLTPEKSTRIRIVYNASTKSSKTNPSLNDCIYKGIILMNNLLAILLKLRVHRFALIGDIEKAFHTIGINEQDRNYVRFLWVKDIHNPPTNDNLQVYRFTRLAFGIISSPFLMAAVTEYHLKTNPTNSTCIENIRENIYVDNIITGSETIEQGQRIYQETVELFNACKMNVRNGALNSAEIRKIISARHLDTNTIVNVLGINWDVERDTLAVKKLPEFPSEAVNLRNILKYSAQLFDFFGWFARSS